MAKQKKFKQKRKLFFRFIKKIIRIRYKRPEFIFLGKEFENGAIILSNHEGTDAPLSLELYAQAPIRFWGAYEMNSKLPLLYKYQSKVYYHQKKHWPLFLSRLFCIIASPITYLFYRGLNLISIYPDARLSKTIKESVVAIENGDNIVIFPEHSEEGYKEELDGFFAGFTLLAERLYKKHGIDVPIYVSYFRKKDLKYIVDAPVSYSSLADGQRTREEIADILVKRCNELGKMDFSSADSHKKIEK